MSEGTTGALNGRRIYLTGAASGIGRATAELFVAEGATVALVDVQVDALAEVAEATGSWSRVVDLRDRVSTAASVDAAAVALGGLDGVVNCAGMAGSMPLAEMTDEVWDAIMDVNLNAPFVVCRAAIPHLLASDRPATIVNVASGQALLPSAGAGAYASSKAGVASLSKVLGAELSPQVRSNAVCPGIVQTPMTQFILDGYDNPDDAPFVAQYAMGRVAQPLELAQVILFLTSDASSFVTGSVVAADGGRTFH
jgi:NAD(P)-dependent dehydrogenase (short-subunit alcohol dehydrogenase family)